MRYKSGRLVRQVSHTSTNAIVAVFRGGIVLQASCFKWTGLCMKTRFLYQNLKKVRLHSFMSSVISLLFTKNGGWQMSIKLKKATSFLMMIAMVITSFSGLNIKAAAATPDYAKDLFISEYVEGGGNNKAIEIFNGTGKTVDLSNYSVKVVSFSATHQYTASGPAVSLKTDVITELKHNETIILYNNSGKTDTINLYMDGLTTVKKIPTTKMNFNGNDQVVLLKENDSIDIIGVKKPTSNYIMDKTYIRSPEVTQGNVDESDPNLNGEWDVLAKDTFTDLGKHAIAYGTTKVGAVVADIASGTMLPEAKTITFRSLTSGAAVQIAVVTDDVVGAYVSSNTYKVTEPVKLSVKATRNEFEDSDPVIFEYFMDDPNSAPVTVKSVKDGYVDKNKDFKDDNGYRKIEVTVTAKDYYGYTFAQDGSAGIGLKLPTDFSVEVGDTLQIIGVMSSDYDFMRMVVPNKMLVKKVGTSKVEPEVVTLEQIGKDLQGKFVRVNNVTIKSGPNYTDEFTPDTKANAIIKPAKPQWIEAGTTYEVIQGVVFYSYKKYSVAPIVEEDVLEFENGVRPIIANPAEGLVKDNITLTTSPAGATIYYTIDGTTPTKESTKYVGPFAISDYCILKAIGMEDGRHSSRVFSAEFYPNAPAGTRSIPEIQGDGHSSGFKFRTVENVKGVITAVTTNGFYMQDPTGDGNDKTSDAIYVKKSSSDATKYAVKNLVSVAGTVYENLKDQSLSVTELRDTEIKIVNAVVELPAPVVLGEGGRIIPNKVIDNDGFKVFDPEEDAIDFYETLECMYVKVNAPLVTGNYSNKEFNIVSDKGKFAQDRLTIYGGIKWTEGSSNPDNLLVTSSLFNNTKKYKVLPNMGSEFAGPVVGIIGYRDSKFTLMNTEELPNLVSADQATQYTKLERETTDISFAQNKLTVASYNIENFSIGNAEDNERVKKIAETMVVNLNTPDIIGLLEIQDDNGQANNGIVDASKSLELLANTINQQTNGKTNYGYLQISPVNNMDGGAPGANIRVAYLYNKNRVSLANGKPGDSTTPVKVVNGHLSLNPGRIIPEDISVFNSTRKSLAVEFNFYGDSVVVIANHFSSKSGSTPLYGSVQPPFDPAFASRTKQGIAVNAFIKEMIKQNPKANIIALGDLNAYEFEEAAVNLAGKELVNLHYTLPLNQRFTYMFQGSSQVLDQMMVSKHLVNGSKFDAVHINAFFTENEGSVSDHDPVLAQLVLPNVQVKDGGAKDNDTKSSGDSGSSTSSSSPVAPTSPVKPTAPATDIQKSTEAAKTKAKNNAQLTDAEKALLKAALKEELKAQGTSDSLEVRKQFKENLALLNKMIGSVEVKAELLKNPEQLTKLIESTLEALKKEMTATGLNNAKAVLTLKTAEDKMLVSLQAADMKLAKASGADLLVATENASVKVLNNQMNTDKTYKVSLAKDEQVKGTSAKQMSKVTSGVQLDTEFKSVQLALPVDQAQAKKLGVFKFDEVRKAYVLVQSQLDSINSTLVVKNASNGQYVVAEVKASFTDTAKTWAKNTISEITARRIMVGESDTKFSPENTITRAEFAAALLNIMGQASAESGNWKQTSVTDANKLALGGNFLTEKTADKAITREEMAFMLAKVYAIETGHDVKEGALNFKDAQTINKAFQTAVAEAQTLGLVKGMTDGNFKPSATGTRAEAAQMLLNLAINL